MHVLCIWSIWFDQSCIFNVCISVRVSLAYLSIRLLASPSPSLGPDFWRASALLRSISRWFPPRPNQLISHLEAAREHVWVQNKEMEKYEWREGNGTYLSSRRWSNKHWAQATTTLLSRAQKFRPIDLACKKWTCAQPCVHEHTRMRRRRSHTTPSKSSPPYIEVATSWEDPAQL